jgi:cell division septal protein FtsQ
MMFWAYFHGSLLWTGLSEDFLQTVARLGFKLEDVIVEGRIRTDKGQILKILELERGKPLLAINLTDAKEKLEKISWVKAARVERRFPDTLFIRISEKEPIALWQNQGKTYLLDRDGEIVETKEPINTMNCCWLRAIRLPIMWVNFVPFSNNFLN